MKLWRSRSDPSRHSAAESGSAELLGTLRGRDLSAVTFVRDYLQLQFDGACLNVYVWPTIRNGDIVLHQGASGYRDALCQQIGKPVETTLEVPNEKLALTFVDGASFEISLRPENLVRSEAALLRDDFTKQWVVW